MTENKISLESRVASSETAIASLAQSIDRVTSLVGRLESSVDAGFRDINNRWTEGRKPQYALVFGTIFAACSVMLTIVGGVGKIVLDGQGRDINRNEAMTAKLVDANMAMAITLGERKGVIERNAQAIETLDAGFARIEARQYDNRDLIISLKTHLDDTVANLNIQETRLQNEIKLTESKTVALLDAMDRRLQDEIAREKVSSDRATEAISNLLNKTVEIQLAGVKDSATNSARINAMEKKP